MSSSALTVPSPPTAASFVVKEGWLVKQGGKYKTWKKRWFVLKNNHISYHKEPNKEAVGLITFNIVSSVTPAPDWDKKGGNKRLHFRVNVADGRPGGAFLIGANDEETLRDWMHKIDETLAKYRKTGVGLNALSFDKPKERDSSEQNSEELLMALKNDKPKPVAANKGVINVEKRRHSSIPTKGSALASSGTRLSTFVTGGSFSSLSDSGKLRIGESFSEEDVSDDEDIDEDPETKFDDEMKSKELYRAIESGKHSAIKAWLQLGTLVNWKNTEQSNQTALHAAVLTGDSRIVMDLLNNNANVHVQDSNGVTPLHLAAAHGYDSCIRVLTDVPGINLLVADSNNRHPLYAALFTGHKSCANLLLDHLLLKDHSDNRTQWKAIQDALNGDIAGLELIEDFDSIKYNNELTPFHAASSGNSLETVKYILSKTNYSAQIKDAFERSALHYAAASDATEVLKYLLEQQKLDVNQRDKQCKSAIHYAAGLGREHTLSLLLSYQCLQGKDQSEFTPLHLAATYGHHRCVDLLLECAIDPNGKAVKGLTPLYLASHCGSVETVQSLLNKRANINQRTDEMKTPLHEACARGNHKIVELLLANKANIEATDHQGNSPLLVSIMANSPECMALLIEAGADVLIKNTSGDSALSLAVNNGDVDMVSRLLDQGLDCNEVVRGVTPLFSACAQGNKSIVKLFVANGVDVDFQDRWKSTPLLRTISLGHYDIATILLEEGANVNHQTTTGVSPLQEAAVMNRVDCLELLLSAGCQVDITNDQGATPLHEAASKGNVDCMARLIIFGASLHAKDSNDYTPIERAAENGKHLAVMLLVAHGATVPADVHKSLAAISESILNMPRTPSSTKLSKKSSSSRDGSAKKSTTEKKKEKKKSSSKSGSSTSSVTDLLERTVSSNSIEASGSVSDRRKEKSSKKSASSSPAPASPAPSPVVDHTRHIPTAVVESTATATTTTPANNNKMVSSSPSRPAPSPPAEHVKTSLSTSDNVGEKAREYNIANLHKPPAKRIVDKKPSTSSVSTTSAVAAPPPVHQAPSPPAPTAASASGAAIPESIVCPDVAAPAPPPPSTTTATTEEDAPSKDIVDEQYLAKNYIKSAQKLLGKEDYRKFHKLLLDYQQQTLSIEDLFEAIHLLFSSPQTIGLLENFVTFVPEQYKDRYREYFAEIKHLHQ